MITLVSGPWDSPAKKKMAPQNLKVAPQIKSFIPSFCKNVFEPSIVCSTHPTVLTAYNAAKSQNRETENAGIDGKYERKKHELE